MRKKGKKKKKKKKQLETRLDENTTELSTSLYCSNILISERFIVGSFIELFSLHCTFDEPFEVIKDITKNGTSKCKISCRLM